MVTHTQRVIIVPFDGPLADRSAARPKKTFRSTTDVNQTVLHGVPTRPLPTAVLKLFVVVN